MRPRAPHAIPYQGSKRLLAPAILRHVPASVGTLIEPFCGSAAVSLAVATERDARIHFGDSFAPLCALWSRILVAPQDVAAVYERHWHAQADDPGAYYLALRAHFNRERDPDLLLFLLARCVKSAVRFNAQGEFNQSPDHRRLGTRPLRMRANLEQASRLLAGRTRVTHGDYATMCAEATPRDLVYLDPPYQGTSGPRDSRYHALLDRARFIEDLEALRVRGVPVIVSFDGRSGDRTYGPELPRELGFVRLELDAGRSSQATLNGGDARTIESLYVSPSLVG